MAKVIKNTPPVKAQAGKPAVYVAGAAATGKTIAGTWEEVLEALREEYPGPTSLYKFAEAVPAVAPTPGEVVLSLTYKEALMLRRVAGHHLCGSSPLPSQVYNALVTVFPHAPAYPDQPCIRITD